MKRTTTLWLTIFMLVVSIPAMGTMSISKMRQNARFLTDRMAYELRLSPIQYEDVYEVNYDFINSVRYLMDDVVRGYGYAIDRYYDYLDYRNEDLRWILSASQYRRFMGVDYFCRPIYTTANNWLFRIYNVYHDVKHFYFDKPYHYRTYSGGHSRLHHQNGYYKHHWQGRYHHKFHQGKVDVRSGKSAGHRPENVSPSKQKRERPSAQMTKPSERKSTMDRQKEERRRESSTVRESRRETRQTVRTTDRKETQKRSNSRSSDGRQENGRHAGRSR